VGEPEAEGVPRPEGDGCDEPVAEAEAEGTAAALAVLTAVANDEPLGDAVGTPTPPSRSTSWWRCPLRRPRLERLAEAVARPLPLAVPLAQTREAALSTWWTAQGHGHGRAQRRGGRSRRLRLRPCPCPSRRRSRTRHRGGGPAPRCAGWQTQRRCPRGSRRADAVADCTPEALPLGVPDWVALMDGVVDGIGATPWPRATRVMYHVEFSGSVPGDRNASPAPAWRSCPPPHSPG
jgi:hypothetical protein